MKKLIIASIFLLPLASALPIRGTIVWYSQLLVLMGIGLTLLALQLWKMNKFISLLMCYEVFSYIFITSQSPRAMLCLMIGFSAISFSYAISLIKDTRVIYKCIVALAIFQFIYVLLQSFNIDFIFHGPNGKADLVGFMGSHNQLGAYFSSVSVILASINPFLILVSVIPIFLAKQNGAMIGLIAGFLSYAYFTWNIKKVIFILAILLVAIIPWIKFAGKSNNEIMERINLWKSSIHQTISGRAIQKNEKYTHISTCNPIFGYGLSNFFIISPLTQLKFLDNTKGHLYEHAHNDLVEGFFEFGLIGLILIILSIFTVIFDFINCLHTLYPNTKLLIVSFCSLLGLSVTSMSIYVFHAPVSLFMFCLILGLFYREVNYAKITIKQTA